MNEADIFHVETVEIASEPQDNADAGWCRYVVSSERSRIVGRCRGTLTHPRRSAEHLVTGLNDRLKTGKVPRPSRRPPRKPADRQRESS